VGFVFICLAGWILVEMIDAIGIEQGGAALTQDTVTNTSLN